MFLVEAVVLAASPPQTSQSQTQTGKSTIDVLGPNQGCQAGETSKTVKVTLTVTNQSGQSASKTTNITVNCKPVFLRLPDLIFYKDSASVDECSRRILIDQASAIVNTGKYNVILIGYRSRAENTVDRRGAPLDHERAVQAAAVLIQCAAVRPSMIRIGAAGAAKNPVPTSVSCEASFGSGPMPADWYSRVEVYLVPNNSASLPQNAPHLEKLPATLPQTQGCGDAAR